jgi:hypothetical protein
MWLDVEYAWEKKWINIVSGISYLRPFGRTNYKWGDNIKMNYMGYGFRAWTRILRRVIFSGIQGLLGRWIHPALQRNMSPTWKMNQAINNQAGRKCCLKVRSTRSLMMEAELVPASCWSPWIWTYVLLECRLIFNGLHPVITQEPVTIAERSEAWIVFTRSDAVIASSNPT